MAKRRSNLEHELARRGHLSRSQRNGPGAIGRRGFLRLGAGAGALAGMPSLLAGCFAGSDDTGGLRQRPTERRTIFFNFAHEDFAKTAHLLVLGRHRYALTKTRDNPQVLAEARKTNRFLRGVADDQITHHLEAVETLADAVQLAYVISNADLGSGTWSMSGMYLVMPLRALLQAHAMGLAGRRPVLLSVKRKRHGQGPALSAQDLVEEHALFDAHDHAATLIGMHPELLSVEPVSSAYVRTHHVALNAFTGIVAEDMKALGPAQPQKAPGKPNDGVGWATMVPMTDDDGVPLRNTTGKNKGLLHYNPEWNPRIGREAAQAMTGCVRTTKDDPQLGADVTAALNAVPGATRPSYEGSIWLRRDGIGSIDQSNLPPRASGSSLKYTVTDETPMNGFRVSATASQNGDGTVPVVLTLENWYLRWLGVFIEFYDSSPTPVAIAVSSLPASLTKRGEGVNTATAVYMGVVTPEFVILGIPVEESKATIRFDFPPGASSARILASGLGYGSHTYQDTEALGIALTSVFNLIIPTILLSLGLAQGVDQVVKLVALPAINLAVTEYVAFIADATVDGTPNFSNLLSIFWRTLLRALGAPGALKAYLSTTMTQLLILMKEWEAIVDLEDTFEAIGIILQAIGAVGTIAEIAETTFEATLSPWTYETDLVLTHDLALTILPDSGDGGTPADANRYQVTALFDKGGTPRVIDMPLPQPKRQVDVLFAGVPLGGNVSVSAAFLHVPDDPARDHVILGKASTGLVANTTDTLAPIRITNVKFPIGPSTRYRHQQKTVLRAGASGQVHAWDASQPAPTAKASDIKCAAQGDLCRFNGITVRQATQQDAGYVGYAWSGNSAGVNDCVSGGQSDSGQLANLNTDSTNGGTNAQAGYATAPCGLQQRPLLTYSLLAHGRANYYLDTTNGVVRQVALDPPAFSDPRGDQAFGAFNLESTALLLHPTGRLISINQANHKLETLNPALTAMTDKRLAQLHAGQGARPGLLTSPTAAAVSAEGIVLVLEAGNPSAAPPVPARIQAFDIGANAVPYFGKQPVPYFLQLGVGDAQPRTYLDMAVEFTGFIYVLSYAGSAAADGLVYRLDIYHTDQPGSAPISSTQDVNAAKLCVDFWRSVYTLNYEVLASNSGQAEPSVSLWLPTT